MKNFELQWKQTFSFFPQIAGLPYEEREKLKAFAEYVYAHNEWKKEFEEVTDEAYEEGYQDAELNVTNDLKEEFEQIIQDNVDGEIREILLKQIARI